jgi:hypothetical protein
MKKPVIKNPLRLATLLQTLSVDDLKAELDAIEAELRRRKLLPEKGERLS